MQNPTQKPVETIAVYKKLEDGMIERYANFEGSDGTCILLSWRGAGLPGRLHSFDRETGECLESPMGVMRGYQIYPDDLKRLARRPSVECPAIPDPWANGFWGVAPLPS